MNALPATRSGNLPPSNEVGTGPTVSGRTLLGVLITATFLFGGLALYRIVPSLLGSVAVGLVFAVAVAVRSRPPVPQLILFAGAAMLLAVDTAFSPAVFLLLPLAHVMLRASWWVARDRKSTRLNSSHWE